ncbi:hypothetical protein PFISCL1PPCAC_21531, partial [Pristionchus fissidentatus]
NDVILNPIARLGDVINTNLMENGIFRQVYPLVTPYVRTTHGSSCGLTPFIRFYEALAISRTKDRYANASFSAIGIAVAALVIPPPSLDLFQVELLKFAGDSSDNTSNRPRYKITFNQRGTTPQPVVEVQKKDLPASLKGWKPVRPDQKQSHQVSTNFSTLDSGKYDKLKGSSDIVAREYGRSADGDQPGPSSPKRIK